MTVLSVAKWFLDQNYGPNLVEVLLKADIEVMQETEKACKLRLTNAEAEVVVEDWFPKGVLNK